MNSCTGECSNMTTNVHSGRTVLFENVNLSPPGKVFSYAGQRLGKTERAKQIANNTEHYAAYLKLVHTGESFSDDDLDAKRNSPAKVQVDKKEGLSVISSSSLFRF